MKINTLHKLNLRIIEESFGFMTAEILGHGKKMELFFCRVLIINQLKSNSQKITHIAGRMNRTKSGIIYALKHYHVCRKYSQKFREIEEKLIQNQKKEIKKWKISMLKARRSSICARGRRNRSSRHSS